MKEKKSWDDIPSLDGVGVEWEYQPKTALGKRAFIRINTEDLSGLFSVREILVKVATAQQTYTGHLLDISKCGLSASLPVALAEELPVKVGLFLGTVKVISNAVIRHIRKEGAMYTIGVEFVNLDKESAEYIGGLYASKILNHTK